MYHYTYQITNLINNKIYYGVHSTECLPKEDNKYWGSGVIIKRAINKYGIENFSKEIDKLFETRDEANLYEAEIVNLEFVEREDTYNLQTGGMNGYGWKMSQESKDKISNTLKGRCTSIGMLGRKHTEETIRKMSEVKIGKKCSQEAKDKISNTLKGRPLTEETKIKMSESRKGKKHSDEWKKNISIALRGRKISKESIRKIILIKSKNYIATSPLGNEYFVKSLREFCIYHNLNRGHMSSVANGNKNSHKGWKCKKID